MARLLALLLLSWMLLGCSVPARERVSAGVDPCDSFRLTDAQRSEAQRRARSGDARSAKRLADEAIYVRKDYREGIAWLRLAASYGDKQAKHALSVYLEGMRDAK